MNAAAVPFLLSFGLVAVSIAGYPWPASPPAATCRTAPPAAQPAPVRHPGTSTTGGVTRFTAPEVRSPENGG